MDTILIRAQVNCFDKQMMNKRVEEEETSPAVAMKPGRTLEAMQQVAAALCPLKRLGSVISAARIDEDSALYQFMNLLILLNA